MAEEDEETNNTTQTISRPQLLKNEAASKMVAFSNSNALAVKAEKSEERTDNIVDGMGSPLE